MRTTLDINDRLLKDAEGYAANRRQSLKALVEEALRQRLRAPTGKRLPASTIPSLPGKGLQPGVDLTDNAALLDVMNAKSRR